MVEYSRIGVGACDSLCNPSISKGWTTDRWQESLGFFQYRLDQWQKNIPSELQFAHHDSDRPKRVRLLRAILYLRANQLRILILRPFLCSKIGFAPDAKIGTTATNIACDSIQLLAHLAHATDLYPLQVAVFNYFLMSALGVVMLTTIREPLTKKPSSPSGSQEQWLEQSIYMKARNGVLVGLNLLFTLAESSRSSRRLWNRASSLGFRLHGLGILKLDPLQNDVDAVTVDNETIYPSNSGEEEARPRPALDLDAAEFVLPDPFTELDMRPDLGSLLAASTSDEIERLIYPPLFDSRR